MSTLQILALLLVALTATGVVITRDLTAQAIVLGIFGFALALLFLLFHAPGVALAQVVISGIVLPVLVLLTLAKVRSNQQ